MSKKWYIATNTENLKHFIDYGLIIDKQGFTGTSYVVDAMQNVPEGYIPCFSAGSLFPALEKAKEEDENLSCCLLELDVKQIAETMSCGGLVQANDSIIYQKKDSIRELANSEDINCILLPAPLPFSCIKNIILQDDKTKKNIQDAYGKLFSVKNISFKKLLNLFKRPKNIKERPPELPNIEGKWEVEQRKIDYSKVFSYGGALGLLYYQTKNGRESTKIFKIFSDLFMETSINDDSELLKPFKSYLLDIQASEDSIINIYKLIMDKIINTTDASIARFNVLNILKNVDVSEKYNSKCKVLAKRLEEIIERTIEVDAKTIFESIINKAYADDIEFKTITLLITMFFLRDNLKTMLKYYHSELTETHYSLLAIFFGMSYGVVSIPSEVRKIDDLSTWLSYKMAEYAHNIDEGNTVGFKEPKKPLLLYGDIIRSEPTKNHIVYSLYKWLDDKFKNKINQSLVENIQKIPKKGSIENEYITSNGLSDTRLAIKVELLEYYIQQQIKEDTLFNSNEIILAYKKYTK